MLAGKKYNNRSLLCTDCKENAELVNDWDWYKIAERMRFHTKVFLWLYPIMIVTGIVIMLNYGKSFGWNNVVNYIICFGFWACAFKYYRKRNYKQYLSEHVEKMFVLKMNGGKMKKQEDGMILAD